jgi:hypothetical protein
MARKNTKTRRAETSSDSLRCDWCGRKDLFGWDSPVFRIAFPFARQILRCGDVSGCGRVLTIDAEGAD